MKRQNSIVLTAPNLSPEVWGNFKKMCESKCFPYHSLKSKSFPIEFEIYVIYKVPQVRVLDFQKVKLKVSLSPSD